MGAHGQKGRVEAASQHAFLNIGDLCVVFDGNAKIGDPLDLGVQHIARQTILRNAETHHPARGRPCFLDGHGVPEPREVVGRR